MSFFFNYLHFHDQIQKTCLFSLENSHCSAGKFYFFHLFLQKSSYAMNEGKDNQVRLNKLINK